MFPKCVTHLGFIYSFPNCSDFFLLLIAPYLMRFVKTCLREITHVKMHQFLVQRYKLLIPQMSEYSQPPQYNKKMWPGSFRHRFESH